jgi:hypothetical protein
MKWWDCWDTISFLRNEMVGLGDGVGTVTSEMSQHLRNEMVCRLHLKCSQRCNGRCGCRRAPKLSLGLLCKENRGGVFFRFQ